jgi:transcriptional regulator with XRE-family HTH domain
LISIKPSSSLILGYVLGMTELSRRLGEAVKVLRERRGLSQESLAAQAGVHRSTVLHVENDLSPKAGPVLDTVERLARGLNLTPSDLIAYADGSEDPEEDDEG